MICLIGLSYNLTFLKILFIYFLREGKGGRKRGRDTSVCGCLSHAPYWDLACNPGMYPDWESNQWPFGSQTSAQSTELHQSGHNLILFSWNNSIVSWFKIQKVPKGAQENVSPTCSPTDQAHEQTTRPLTILKKQYMPGITRHLTFLKLDHHSCRCKRSFFRLFTRRWSVTYLISLLLMGV